MSAVYRSINAIGAVCMVVMACRVTPVLWQVGPLETVVVIGCMARMAVDMIEYAATGRSTA